MIKKIEKLFVALPWLALDAVVQAQLTFTTNDGVITITGLHLQGVPTNQTTT